MAYDIAIYMTDYDSGLTKPQLLTLLNKMSPDDEIMTLELQGSYLVAYGFVSYDVLHMITEERVHHYITTILDSLEVQNDAGEYEFDGVSAYIAYTSDDIGKLVVDKPYHDVMKIVRALGNQVYKLEKEVEKLKQERAGTKDDG